MEMNDIVCFVLSVNSAPLPGVNSQLFPLKSVVVIYMNVEVE